MSKKKKKKSKNTMLAMDNTALEMDNACYCYNRGHYENTLAKVMVAVIMSVTIAYGLVSCGIYLLPEDKIDKLNNKMDELNASITKDWTEAELAEFDALGFKLNNNGKISIKLDDKEVFNFDGRYRCNETLGQVHVIYNDENEIKEKTFEKSLFTDVKIEKSNNLTKKAEDI